MPCSPQKRPGWRTSTGCSVPQLPLRKAGALLALREANYSNSRAAPWVNPPHHLPWTFTAVSLYISPTTHSQVSTGRNQPQLTAAQAARQVLGGAAPAGLDAKALEQQPLLWDKSLQAKENQPCWKAKAWGREKKGARKKNPFIRARSNWTTWLMTDPSDGPLTDSYRWARDCTETVLQYALLIDCWRLPVSAA